MKSNSAIGMMLTGLVLGADKESRQEALGIFMISKAYTALDLVIFTEQSKQ